MLRTGIICNAIFLKIWAQKIETSVGLRRPKLYVIQLAFSVTFNQNLSKFSVPEIFRREQRDLSVTFVNYEKFKLDFKKCVSKIETYTRD